MFFTTCIRVRVRRSQTDTRNGQDRRHSGRDAKRRRGGREEIDPLDPLGKAGGKWSDGLVQVRVYPLVYGVYPLDTTRE